MKKLFATSAAAAALCLSAGAQAAEMNWDSTGGLYLRLDTGWSFSEDAGGDFDTDVGDSYIFGGGVGYRFNDYLRGDVTIGYRGGYDIEDTQTFAGVTGTVDGEVSSLTGMVNVYADVYRFGMVTPYVGGGIGLSRNSVDDLSASLLGLTATVDDESKVSFAWQASAGLGIAVSPNVTIDVGYRYMDLGSAETGDTATVAGTTLTGVRSEGDISAHEIQLGLRYSF